MSESSQESSLSKLTFDASFGCRIGAFCLFLLIGGMFWMLWAGGHGVVDLGYYYGACGFKQSYGVPCPGCFWTRSGIAFMSGDVVGAFNIQPAAAFSCVFGVVVAVFALLTGVFGLNLRFVEKVGIGRLFRYVLVSGVVIVLGGWCVTLARALAES